ncbi:MAG TPA: hypothetical protein PKE56_05640 [Acidimicrobiales bacterium]|nr:hypothetical protein [Acidimicrobiales bacterium]
MRQRPRFRTLAALVLAAALTLGAAGCGDDELTPEEQQRERVEKRLKLSFSDEQATCMLERFDDTLFEALDQEGQLPTGPALDEFSEIARDCVVGESTASTTSAPASTTTADGAADSTTTTAADAGETTESSPDGSTTSTTASGGEPADGG